eukprot:gene25015-32594_t
MHGRRGMRMDGRVGRTGEESRGVGAPGTAKARMEERSELMAVVDAARGASTAGGVEANITWG